VTVSQTNDRPLQRLAMARQQQGISCRTVARRLNVAVEQVRQQERETADLPLSTLYAWQKALDLPVAELLVEPADTLAPHFLERSQLLRLMKTVLAIRQHARQKSVRWMAQTMSDQLVKIMPELARVRPWHTAGKRRPRSDLGMAAQRRLAEDVFVDRSN
jgi:transcriptional regulator with XRE-family HTH domain